MPMPAVTRPNPGDPADSGATQDTTIVDQLADRDDYLDASKAESTDVRFADERTPTDGSVTTTKLGARAVTWAKTQAVATARILGRKTAGSGDVEELTGADVAAMLPDATATTRGLVPTPPNNTTTFLRGDGIFAAPAGGGGGYATVKDEGTSLTARTVVDFVGAGVKAEDDGAGSKTKVSVHGPAVVAPQCHGPISAGQVSSFGTYQLMYLIPFVGNGVSVFGGPNASFGPLGPRCNVEVAGAGGVVRFGVYVQSSSSTLSKVFDWGTVDASTTGEKELAITPWTPSAGVTYYLAVCIQGNSAVKVTGTNCSSAVQSYGSYSAYPFSQAFSKASVAGALPASYSAFWLAPVPQFPAITLQAGD